MSSWSFETIPYACNNYSQLFKNTPQKRKKFFGVIFITFNLLTKYVFFIGKLYLLCKSNDWLLYKGNLVQSQQ